MRKKAFTLGEVLIVLVLVGILSVLALQTLKSQKTRFAFSCYYFYRDLKIAVGHMASQTYGGSLNSFSCESVSHDSDAYDACVTAGKAAIGGAGNANILDYRLGNNFCVGLSRYLGTASSIACSASQLNNATLDNIYGNIDGGATPNFKLMNKSLIYVSNRVVGGSSGYKTYRIVSVDLNGKSKPNRTEKDIISFAIFDNGEVLPLGIASTSNEYFSAVIKMRNILPVGPEKKVDSLQALRHPTSLIYSSDKKPLSFRQAYCDVYGSSSNYSNYCSGYSSFSEKFKFAGKDLSVQYCTNSKYTTAGAPAQKFDGKDIVPECELAVLKPNISKLFPTMQDVYSSVGNVDDKDSGTNQANQIYKY